MCRRRAGATALTYFHFTSQCESSRASSRAGISCHRRRLICAAHGRSMCAVRCSISWRPSFPKRECSISLPARARSALGGQFRAAPHGATSWSSVRRACTRCARTSRCCACARRHEFSNAMHCRSQRRAEAETYDIAFADPPYGSRMLDRVIQSWQAKPFARVFAVEHERTHELPAGGRMRTFDESAITIFRAQS